MKLTLDQKTIQLIDLFHTLTGSDAIDCVEEEDCIYFIVAEGQHGLAVGRNGAKIKNAEKVFKKPIHVLEYSTDVEIFIRKILPGIQEIRSENEKTIFVRVRPSDRPKVIGKAGKNIKLLNKIMQRLFEVEIKVR